MRIFATGGSSPLGDYVLPRLRAGGHRVECLARSPEASRRVAALGAVPIDGDLLGEGWLPRVAGADAVIHMAGIRLVGRIVPAVDPAHPLIVVSSASVANPHHPLADVVSDAEEEVRRRVPTAVILRPTMIYGSPRDRNIGSLARLVARLPVVPRFTGGGLIQPVAVQDVADVVVCSLGGAASGLTVECGGPDRVQLGDLLDLLADLLCQRRLPVRIPVRAVAAVASSSRLAGRHRALHAIEMLRYDRTVAPIDATLLGRPPTGLRAGLGEALTAYGLTPPR